MYKEIVEFVRNESAAQSNVKIHDLEGEVPFEVLQSLKSELQKRNSERFKTVKQDSICKQVYDHEREWRTKLIREVIELIGEVPKYSLGTEIREQDKGLSLDKLIDDIMKLPNMDVVDEEHENIDTDHKILKEYTNLRKDLIKKCQAIKVGESILQEREYQASMIQSLFESIEKTSGSDVPLYFETYHSKLSAGLKDTRYLLEDAIKSSESNPAKRLKLQELMD